MIWIKTNGECGKHRSNGIILIKMYYGREQKALARYPTTGACELLVDRMGGWNTLRCRFSLMKRGHALDDIADYPVNDGEATMMEFYY